MATRAKSDNATVGAIAPSMLLRSLSTERIITCASLLRAASATHPRSRGSRAAGRSQRFNLLHLVSPIALDRAGADVAIRTRLRRIWPIDRGRIDGLDRGVVLYRFTKARVVVSVMR